MNWTQLRRVAISLPLAIFAGLVMVAINEIGYKQTSQSLSYLTRTHDTSVAVQQLMEQMLDAETGLRGYILTRNAKYLEPYTQGVRHINASLDKMRDLLAYSPEALELYTPLVTSVNRKTAEMELSLKLFQDGNADALKFVMFTDMGELEMDQIRKLTGDLQQLSVRKSQQYLGDIQSALFLSRMGIATVTVIGVFAFYLYLRQTNNLERLHKREQTLLTEERSRLESLVRERTTSLTELANHLQQVREDERGHLARELHDELGALLTAAKLDVARLKSRIDMANPDVAERVKHLAETLNSGIALKRRIIEDLRPSSLANLGLSTSLEILTSEYAQRSGIDIERNLEPVELSDATELTIYRLIQESLTNIGKYAKASKVIVTVHSFPTYVAVQIEDDGQGFDVASVRPNSHGLAGMRHRVEAAGGRLNIKSALGQGTTISAIIPTTPSPAAPTTVNPALA